jgi:hypothetical protein
MTLAEVNAINPDEAWPVQRLRVGWALILFFFFETLIGKRLPIVMPYLGLGLGLACLISAQMTIRDLRERFD